MASIISRTAEEVQHRSMSLANSVWEHAPNYREMVGFLTLVTAALAVAGVGGLTLAGTTIGMAVLTPVFILFSPVLIPLGTVLILIVAGFFIFGGFALATFSLASWIYNYYLNDVLVDSRFSFRQFPMSSVQDDDRDFRPAFDPRTKSESDADMSNYGDGYPSSRREGQDEDEVVSEQPDPSNAAGEDNAGHGGSQSSGERFAQEARDSETFASELTVTIPDDPDIMARRIGAAAAHVLNDMLYRGYRDGRDGRNNKRCPCSIAY